MHPSVCSVRSIVDRSVFRANSIFGFNGWSQSICDLTLDYVREANIIYKLIIMDECSWHCPSANAHLTASGLPGSLQSCA